MLVGAATVCKPASVTYVLVHGGGFAGSCWDLLRPRLDAPSVAVDLPGRGSRPGDLASVTIGDFVAAVVEEMVSRHLTDVTLVGHSMAGLTLPGVAELVPERLRRLVFVSCAVPPHGTPLVEVLGSFSPTVAAVADGLGDTAIREGGRLHPDLARAMFCNDMDEDLTAWTLDRMGSEAISVLTEPSDLTGLSRPIPRTYVRLTRDASIDLEAQNRMVATLEPVEVADLDCGHMAMVSAPSDLATVLSALGTG
jgi:pimeloyl-ACP methyl ester carboxylesterase